MSYFSLFKSVVLNGIIDKSYATRVVNTLSNSLSIIIHRSSKNVQKCPTYKGSYSQKHWWNNDCGTAKKPVKFWYDIWKSCGKPIEGHIYLLSQVCQEDV